MMLYGKKSVASSVSERVSTRSGSHCLKKCLNNKSRSEGINEIYEELRKGYFKKKKQNWFFDAQ